MDGEVTLSNYTKTTIRAKTIDISLGGVATTGFPEEAYGDEYQIKILTKVGLSIEFSAQLVRINESVAGFQTLKIDQENLKIIKDLIFEYETTTDFIKQLDEFNLFETADENGNEIEIVFENEPD